MELIDKTDLKILKILSADSRVRIKDLSKAVMMSEPSVKRRIEKMISTDILRTFTVDINYGKLGYTVPFYIKVSNLTIPFTDFIKRVKEINPTLSVNSVTGEENYILQGRAKAISEVEELLAILMSYGKLSTSIILEELPRKKLIDLM